MTSRFLQAPPTRRRHRLQARPALTLSSISYIKETNPSVSLPARQSVSASWNAGLSGRFAGVSQAAAWTRDARRRAERVHAARRQSDAFADDVARRVGACSKAHVRFMQHQQRDAHRQLLAADIQRRLDERRQRDVRIERDLDERRRLLAATRADANRCALPALN